MPPTSSIVVSLDQHRNELDMEYERDEKASSVGNRTKSLEESLIVVAHNFASTRWFGDADRVLLAVAVEHLGHSLLRKFYASESSRVGRHCSCHGRSNAREEGFETTTCVNAFDGSTDCRSALGTL
jgi:hypothetical protein